MRLWRERAENSWIQEDTIWKPDEGNEIEIFRDLQPVQIMQNVHSNGAMLVRTKGPHMRPHPASLPFFMIEAARERQFCGPLMLIRRPLANFSITLATARDEPSVVKLGGLTMLAAGFIRNAHVSPEFYRHICYVKWWSGRMSLRAFVLGALLAKRYDIIFRYRQLYEVGIALIWFALHPMITIGALKFVRKETELRSFLDRVIKNT
jgi:hypothetical protein